MSAARVNTEESFTPEVVVVFSQHERLSLSMKK